MGWPTMVALSSRTINEGISVAFEERVGEASRATMVSARLRAVRSVP